VIKLIRAVEPIVLTTNKAAWTRALIDKVDEYGDYKAIPDAIKDKVVSHYRHADIKEVLFETTFKKCAFCECLPEDGGGFVQVEHFYPKSIYYSECFSWDNFLPACSVCNTNKGDLDTREIEIINPYNDDPNENFHCKFLKILPNHNNVKAINTEREIELNSNRLINSRTELLRKLQILTEELRDLIEIFNGADTQRKINSRRNKLVEKIEEIEKYMQPQSIHSYFCTQVIITDSYYIISKSIIQGG